MTVCFTAAKEALWLSPFALSWWLFGPFVFFFQSIGGTQQQPQFHFSYSYYFRHNLFNTRDTAWALASSTSVPTQSATSESLSSGTATPGEGLAVFYLQCWDALCPEAAEWSNSRTLSSSLLPLTTPLLEPVVLGWLPKSRIWDRGLGTGNVLRGALQEQICNGGSQQDQGRRKPNGGCDLRVGLA